MIHNEFMFIFGILILTTIIVSHVVFIKEYRCSDEEGRGIMMGIWCTILIPMICLPVGLGVMAIGIGLGMGAKP